MEFSRWLRGRRAEIEDMALARAHGISDATTLADPAYGAGLRAAVVAAVDYALAGAERGNDRVGTVPAVLLAHARRAARRDVALDTVLRCYIAGYAVVGEITIQGLADGGCALSTVDLGRISRINANLLDRLIAEIAAEYTQERGARFRNAEERRVERVKMLLDGRLLEPDEFRYEFDAWHIGTIARGPGAEEAIRDLASVLDRRLLLIRPGGGTIWAWLGGRDGGTTKEAELFAPKPWPAELALSLGEPERGVAGWRLTHRQAIAAFPIASRPAPRLVRYADVALLATALRDEVLASSLQRLYLDPLTYAQDGGAAMRQTLRAYCAASRNVSSSAAALGLSRQTVNTRLRMVEDRIGRQLDVCAAEMDTALRLLNSDT